MTKWKSTSKKMNNDMTSFIFLESLFLWSGDHRVNRADLSLSSHVKSSVLSIYNLHPCCPMCLHCGVSELHPRVAAAAPVSPPAAPRSCRAGGQLCGSGSGDCRTLQTSSAEHCRLLHTSAEHCFKQHHAETVLLIAASIAQSHY